MCDQPSVETIQSDLVATRSLGFVPSPISAIDQPVGVLQVAFFRLIQHRAHAQTQGEAVLCKHLLVNQRLHLSSYDI